MYEVKEQKFDSLYEKLLTIYKNIIIENKNELLLLKTNLTHSITNKLDKDKNNYVKLISKLEILNPILTIKRGYSIARINGEVVKSVKNVKNGDKIDIEVVDGKIIAEVKGE